MLKIANWTLKAILSGALFSMSCLSSQALPVNAAQPNTAAKLENIAKYKVIAKEAEAAMAAGDLTTATSRIKDLKKLWDAAESEFRPRAPVHWHHINRAILGALSALRAVQPNAAICKQTIAELLRTFDYESI